MREDPSRIDPDRLSNPEGALTGTGTPLVWRVLQQGTGRIAHLGDALRLELPPSPPDLYSNAQIGDRIHAGRWQPPLRLSVRARFSARGAGEGLRGTAGFGLWNHALGPGIHGVRPPQAVWYFFGAPPFNVPLAMGVPGSGFKAMVIDAARPSFYALLPGLPLGIFLMRVPSLYRLLWPLAQRSMAESEACLDDLDLAAWHTYALTWETARVTFAVDGTLVHVARDAPPGPLGFVAWMDNAYAVATPQGQFALGQVPTSGVQWLELEQLVIERYRAAATSRRGPFAPDR